MSLYTLNVILEPDRQEPHRYNTRVPALPGCLTYGESIEGALANAREAIEGYVDTLLEDGLAVPLDDHPAIATTVMVGTSAAD